MGLENELKELKDKLYSLKEEKATIKSEISVKQKYLDQTKRELQAKLDEYNVEYKKLDATILGLKGDIERRMIELNAKIQELSQ